MDFKDLLDYCKAQAILNTLESDEVTVWRAICRSYSKKFNTPLHMCLYGEVSPEDILLAVFEEQLDDLDLEKDLEDLLDTVYALEDPEYERQKKVELDDFVKQAEAEEDARVKAGKPIHPALKHEHSLKSLPENQEEPKKDLPTGGHLNLSHLENEENPLKQFED